MVIYEKIITLLNDIFPRYIFDWSYIKLLVNKYSNFQGFIEGAILIGLVYFASKADDDKDKDKRGMWRVIALITLISATTNVYVYIQNLIYRNQEVNIGNNVVRFFNLSLNPLSALILCLIVFECYKKSSKRAFFFGISTLSVSVLMVGGFNRLDDIMIYFLLRTVIIGILCAIICHFKYCYSAYILLMIFYMLEKTEGLYEIIIYSNIEYIEISTIRNYTNFIDIALILIIIFTSFIFERVILNIGMKAHTTN